jgi:hypothetical protein
VGAADEPPRPVTYLQLSIQLLPKTDLAYPLAAGLIAPGCSHGLLSSQSARGQTSYGNSDPTGWRLRNFAKAVESGSPTVGFLERSKDTFQALLASVRFIDLIPTGT